MISLFRWFDPQPSATSESVEAFFAFVRTRVTQLDIVDDIWQRYKRSKTLPKEEQEKEWVKIYLSFEQIIINSSPPVVVTVYSKKTLRAKIAETMPLKTFPQSLALLFVSEQDRITLLFDRISQPLVQKIIQSLGVGRVHDLLFPVIDQTLLSSVPITSYGIDFLSLLPLDVSVSCDDLAKIYRLIYDLLSHEIENSFGTPIAQTQIISSYTVVKDTYDQDIVRSFFLLIPEHILEGERLSFLTQDELTHKVAVRTQELEEAKRKLQSMNEELEKKVKERTQELETLKTSLEHAVQKRTQELRVKVMELERLNELMVGRELKMADIKRENEMYKQKLGQVASHA